MAVDVIMPQMGESIFEGTITKWLKKAGDKIERDEPLFEIGDTSRHRAGLTDLALELAQRSASFRRSETVRPESRSGDGCSARTSGSSRFSGRRKSPQFTLGPQNRARE